MDPEKVEVQLPDSYRKVAYLKAKTIAAIQEAPVAVIIRHHDGVQSASQTNAEMQRLSAAFHPIRNNLNLVIAPVNLQEELITQSGFLFVRLRAPRCPDEPTSRRGGDAPCDRIFNLAEAHFACRSERQP
jgi:hypothetical protein